MLCICRTANISRRIVQVLFAVVVTGYILVPHASAQTNTDVTVHLTMKATDGKSRAPSANAPVVVWLSPISADGQTDLTVKPGTGKSFQMMQKDKMFQPHLLVALRCYCEVRCCQRDDDCPNVWMNVAEDVGDALTVEGYGMCRACFVEPEIEPVTVEERKYVVKERVAVWECNQAAGGNSPWGMALAPAGFGIYGGDLLVGNLGDGLINVYDPNTYAYLGQITDATGTPILNSYPGAGVTSSYVGLWELVFGNGVVNGTPSTTNAGDPNTLYFAAGLDAETHGVFGSISQNAATGGTTNFGFSTSSSVATVANDASASLTLAVAPINGFSGPVTFTCSGLPANSTCTFSSPTLTVTPNVSATETLTISTGGYKASNDAAPIHPFGEGSYTALAFMPLACFLLFSGRKKLRITPS